MNVSTIIMLFLIGSVSTISSGSDQILAISPPEKGFFSKMLMSDGIPIKAHADCSDEAIYEAKKHIDTLLRHIPNARKNLVTAGAELHIIGTKQVTSDLPDYRELKGKPFDGKLTVDERTRGLGGLHASCGEENLLKLKSDRYFGRDICSHEFSHCLFNNGLSPDIRKQFREQFERSLKAGLWKPAYASTNVDEFFAELTMWYFGTHGDMKTIGLDAKPGSRWFKKYDPEAFSLMDRLYKGKIPIPLVSPETAK